MSEYKSGFVGVIGYPNAGKSQLVNAIVGEKVSIVTAKPQTTRQRIKGIYTDKKMQAIFVDAPGIIKSTSGINHFLQEEYESVLQESDVIIATLNVDEKNVDRLKSVIDLVSTSKKPWIAVITKTDLGFEHRVGILTAQMKELGVPVVVTSALKKVEETRQNITQEIMKLLPVSQAPLYDDEMYTTQSLREIACEVIREKCFLNLNHELPYQMAIRLRKYEENEQGVDRIYAEIIMAKKRHQPIVLGKGGSVIKKIGMQSRQELEKIAGKKIYLDLHVTVRENWMAHKGLMKEFGYVQP